MDRKSDAKDRSLEVTTDFTGVDNSLFYKDNTLMLFGAAKKVVH